MAGSISSLGLGSSTLTSDVIDKLKKADEAKFVKPFEKRLEENETQTSDINTLKGLAKELKAISDALSSETNYLDVETKVTGDTASVTALAGARVQNFTLDVTQLAQKEIKQSVGFENETSALNISGDLLFDIGGDSYTVTLDGTENLKDIKDKIFDQTDGKVIASSLKVGGDKPFSLVLKSAQTGSQNGFNVTGGASGTFGFTNIQSAQDAKFKLDGVEITRSSNKIDDLYAGVTIELKDTEKKDNAGNIIKSGKTSVSITQKTTNIIENVEKFVEKYNELFINLNTVTNFDAEKKVRGTFQGNNEMNDIKSQLRNSLIVANMDKFGISMERNGEITLDKGKLEGQIKSDFKGAKEFFQGTLDKPGLFTNVKNTLFDLTTSNNGLFKIIEDGLKSSSKNLGEELKNAKSNLDSKYEIMTKQFAAYDAMIAKMNAGFSSLEMMIKQSVTSK